MPSNQETLAAQAFSPPAAQFSSLFDSDDPPAFVPAAEMVLRVQRRGKRMIRHLKKGQALNLGASRRRVASCAIVKLPPMRRARAIRSRASHGRSLKAGDDGDGGGSHSRIIHGSQSGNSGDRKPQSSQSFTPKHFYPWIEYDLDIRDTPYLAELHARSRKGMSRSTYVRMRREAAQEENWERLMHD